MDGTMEFHDALTLCGWFFVLGGAGAFGALFGLALFNFIKSVLNA